MDIISNFLSAKNKGSTLLTPSEELELTSRYYKTKTISLRNEIIQRNLRLVIGCAREYHCSISSRQDLISEGYIGLLKGIERFNPSLGYKLSTYVSSWIRAYMFNFILSDVKLVKIATTASQKKLFFNLNKTKAAIESEGLEVTPELIAERLLVSTKDVKNMEMRLCQDDSFDIQVGSEKHQKASNKLDFVTADGLTPDEALAEFEKERVIGDGLNIFKNSLSKNEKLIYELRLIGGETLEDLGTRLNVSRERVRQIELRIKEKLQRFAEFKNLSRVL
jgi:RNA polymerase sigma-32 factor